MADWSYASEDLREIKKELALSNFSKASDLIHLIFMKDNFVYLAEQNFIDPQLCVNFLKWCNCVRVEFVPPDYKEEWGEGGARGSTYTLYGDFFTAFVSDYEDILAFMLHEYLHHVCDRILWNQVSKTGLGTKDNFTIKERSFIEDMYINAWIEKDFHGVSEKWQSFLSNHDMFHGLIFDEEEKCWNSLLTSDPLPCDNDLNHLYEHLRSKGTNHIELANFLLHLGVWSTALEDKDIKHMINNLQINNEEWNHETCTPCQTEKKEQEKETN